MTDEGRPAGPPGPRDRKRPAPTIDLKATEVASEPVQAAQPADSPTADPPTETPPNDPPPVQPSATSPETEEPRPARPAMAWLPPNFPWPLAAAGAAGVVLTLAVLALAGVFSSRDSGTTIAADARLAQLEQQLRELSARPTPTIAEPKTIDDLVARIARLETGAATAKPPAADTALANRMAALEGEISALAERTDVLARRNDEIAAIAGEARARADAATVSLAELRKAQPPADAAAQRKEIEALSGRVATLERAAKAIEAQLGKHLGGEAASDRALRLFVVANALQTAVDRGSPFAAELDAAKAVAPDPKALAPLDRFAKSGLPDADAFARELSALVPALAKAVGTPPGESGFFERLKANAEKIVRVRPIDDVAGDDAAAIVQRIGVRATRADLAGAMAELAKLPESVRAPAKDWIAKVEARNAAIAASRRFAANALAAVGKPSL